LPDEAVFPEKEMSIGASFERARLAGEVGASRGGSSNCCNRMCADDAVGSEWGKRVITPVAEQMASRFRMVRNGRAVRSFFERDAM